MAVSRPSVSCRPINLGPQSFGVGEYAVQPDEGGGGNIVTQTVRAAEFLLGASEYVCVHQE